MKAWFNQHRHALGSAVRRLTRHPLATIFNLLVIALALSLPAGLYLLLDNAAELGGRVDPDPEVSLFLAPEATGGDVATIEKLLKNHDKVASYRFVSAEQALRELKQSSGLADVLSSLEKNPLPGAFVVRITIADPQILQTLQQEFATWPNVEYVQVDADWAKRLAALLDFGRSGALLLASALGTALIFIIGNTIRLQVLTGKDEIELTKLIGGTDAFVRRPFLYYGVLQGLLGALLAIGLAASAIHLLNRNAAEIFRLYALDFRLHGPALREGLVLAAAAAALGWSGAFVSVSLYLSQIRLR